MASNCITTEDCVKILQNIQCKNKNLSKFTLKPFSDELRGYMAEPLLLTIELDTNEKVKYFVKCMKYVGGFYEPLKDHKYYEKELFVYVLFKKINQLHPNININVIPELIYHNSAETLVLQNLTLTGYKGPELMDLDKPHVLLLLDALAKFHCVSIAYEHSQSKILGKKYQLSHDHADQFITFFSDDVNLNGFKYTKYGELGGMALIDLIYPNDEKFKSVYQKYCKKFLRILHEDNDFTKVLCHGDIWAFNSLYKYENEKPIDCKLVDFQITRYAPPAHDVTFAIYSCSELKDMQENMHDYYDHYYNSLKNELEKIGIDINIALPLDEYLETLKIYMPVAKFIWLYYRQMSVGCGEYLAEMMKNNKTFNTMVLGKGRIDYIKHCYKNFAEYREGTKEIIDDVRMALLLDIVTIEDCYKLIEKSIGSKNYDIVDIKMAEKIKHGFLGEHYNLLIIINSKNGRKQLSYFVKTIPSTELYKKFVSSTKSDYKEMQFYAKIIEDFKKQNITILQEVVPECYQNSLKILVLEDLKQENYSNINPRDYINPDNFKIALSALAKFHASGLVYEEKVGTKLDKIYAKELGESLYSTNDISEKMLNAARKGLIESIRLFSNHDSNITSEEFENTATKILDRFRNFAEPSIKYRNTICHGDFRPGNILLNQSSAKITNFQFYRYSPPGNDLMQFIYFATSKATRSKYQQEFLDYYYGQFKNVIENYGCNIKTILPYQEFLDTCKDGKLFAITQACTHFQRTLLSPESMQLMFADADFSQKPVFEDRAKLVRMQANQDPIYAERMRESISELREMCENMGSSNNGYYISYKI